MPFSLCFAPGASGTLWTPREFVLAPPLTGVSESGWRRASSWNFGDEASWPMTSRKASTGNGCPCARELATSDEHFVLRRQHLIEIALHEDNLIVECLRQKPQQERNDLHSFAARVSEPGRVAVLVELLD